MAYVPSRPEEFLSFVAAIVKQIMPRARVTHNVSAGLFVDGGAIDLENLKIAIAARPKKGPQYVVEFAEKLRDSLLVFSGGGGTWEFWRDRLVPRLVPASQIPESERPFVVTRPLVGELLVLLAVDLPTAVVPLPLAQVLQWGQDPDAALDEAGENLRALSDTLKLKSAEAPDKTRVVWAERASPHNAALLAVPRLFERLEELTEIDKGEKGVTFGVCAPARGVFFAHAPFESAAGRRMKEAMLQRTASLPHQLDTTTYLVTADGLVDESP